MSLFACSELRLRGHNTMLAMLIISRNLTHLWYSVESENILDRHALLWFYLHCLSSVILHNLSPSSVDLDSHPLFYRVIATAAKLLSQSALLGQF